ncbi:MAG: DNA mismatch repair endonuclease MutL [Pseudobutyrivibrio sp.]|nr:DNA mismatch repair endonuclease MutL [Pseudobutyrivibrio sp.]
MTKINVLSQETIDKIAAGEVVERPSSVVKELIENAIDAGADAITVEIKDGGIEYIRITDNGFGIDKSQIQLAFLRHTTSKINDSKDLFSIQSLGFRGEALSSISAVSKVELLTKPKDQLLGARYVIEGGAEQSLSDIGCPNGTTFIVRQLFYNTPARKKFLKKEATEASYIFDVVEHLALSHPLISFRFINEGKTKLMTSGNGNLSDIIYQVYGREISNNLLEINHEDDIMSVYGFIGKSVIARGNRAFEHFYINKRYIKSEALSRACEEGYFGYLMGHQFPFLLLNIEFKQGIVDVNVHPTKQEVRFDNADYVRETLTRVVHERLNKREDIIEAVVEEPKVSPATCTKSINYISDVQLSVKASKPANKNIATPEPFEVNRLNEIKAKISQQIREDSPYEKKYESKAITTSEKETFQQLSFLSEEAKKSHKIIGQVFNTYWIIEYDKAMYVIDQHAAHEKVLFERTMKRLKNDDMTSQQINPPIVVTVSPSELQLFNEYTKIFTDFGYEIEDFGGNELAIKAVPGNLLNLEPKALFLEILAECDNFKASGAYESVIEKVASLSCKAAVKGNNKLSVSEIDELIKELLTLDNPYHCPHGRPTMISFTEYELGKKFKRII